MTEITAVPGEAGPGRATAGPHRPGQISRGTAADWPAIAELMAMTFHGSPEDEAGAEAVFEPDRSLLIRDGGEIVAHAAAYTRDLTVPGAVLPAAHVTMVGVAPTHRRQGMLTRLMHHQLAEVPEPIAVLWASEGRIYPRFGYGVASQRVSLKVETREVRLPTPTVPGRVRTVPADAARPRLRDVYEAVRADRPGMSSRDDRWWGRRLDDPPGQREGATALRVSLHDSGGGPDGYALWRARGNWGQGGPQGEVRVEELMAASPAAYLGLWRFLLGIDLTRSLTFRLTGPDEPLLWLADEPRRLRVTQGDGLYVRIVDLPAALSGRRYAAPVDLVIEVTDPLLTRNSGRWHLVGGPDRASCVRTDRPADLACGIGELGAAYLGGTKLTVLADAGRVRELTPGVLAAASTAFGWHRAPVSIEIF